MKYFLSILTLVLFQFSCWSQNKTANKDESMIAARVESLRMALIDPNAKQLTDLTAKELSYGHSSGLVENRQLFIETLVNGESKFITIDFQNQTIEIIGEVALVRHNLAALTKKGGVEKDIKIGVLLVWKKQKNNWFLIARQAYKLPS